MELKKRIWDARVPLGMLVVQLIATGLQILSRVILNEGTFIFALMTYRNIIAAFTVLPFALYFERGVVRQLSFVAFFWLFMVALTGISMAMGLFYYGLKDTSATYATDFLNLIPVITFLLSTILRVEKLGLKTRSGKIKITGAMMCLAGALTMALYKGKSVILTHHHYGHTIINQSNQNKVRGTLFLVASCLSYGFWFILQVKLFKVFPYKYWATTLTCIIASIQAAVIGLCIDRKSTSWTLAWNLQLLTIFYSGVLATAATFSLISMAIALKGPTYPSMFNPLSLIFIAMIEAIFLGEEISIGSLIGMALIVVGLYSFLWGKNNNNEVTLPLLKESGGGGAPPESAAFQSSSTIVPAASLNSPKK